MNSKFEIYIQIASKLEYSRRMWRGAGLQAIQVCPICGAVKPGDYNNIILKERHTLKYPVDYRLGHLPFCEYYLLNNILYSP